MNWGGSRNAWGLLLLVGWISLLACSKQRRPNVVFILADDLGWKDLGCYGSEFYETPNLDRLAQEGMRFTDAYASASVCSPTRASLLTGKSPARLHLTDWLPGRPDQPTQKLLRPKFQTFLPTDERTLAEALKEVGYATACIGKWHLGDAPGCWPEHQGFDLNMGGSGKGNPTSYFSPYALPNLSDGAPGEYLSDRLTDEAIRFMEQNRARPFFLYVPHYAVHTPLQIKGALEEKYRAKAASLVNPNRAEFLPDLGHPVRQVQNHPTYAAMIENLDEGVGRILERITALGLENNTIVIFNSDNGGLSMAGGSPTSNLPLRGGKGWPYEGGVRVPLIVRWPGMTRPSSSSSQPVISADLYPTILQMVGLSPRQQEAVDGVSFLPVIRGGNPPEHPLFWHYPHYSNQGGAPCGAVRLGDWKLIEWYEDQKLELYDLKADLGEKNNLAQQNLEKTDSLVTLLHDRRQRVLAQMPTLNPDYEPNAKP